MKIRVHPWRRKHQWHCTRGLPSAARLTNAASRVALRLQTTGTDSVTSVASVVQKTPPHSCPFVFIRGSFVVQTSAQRKTFEAYRLEGSSLQQGLSGTCCIAGSVLRRAACLSELAVAFSGQQQGFGFSGRNHFCSQQKLYATTVPKAKKRGDFPPDAGTQDTTPVTATLCDQKFPGVTAENSATTMDGRRVL